MCRAELVPGRDHDWQELEAAARPADCVPVAATDPLYILYTSGTTGIPKGVVRDNGGHAVALAWSMRNIYGVQPDEVFWTASDVGWVVGHSYIVYGPLIHGCTSVMYEGKPVGTPDAGAFWRVIEQHEVRVFFTAPTAFRAIKREDPDGELIRAHDLSAVPRAVPGRRARRSADRRLGRGAAAGAGHRPLVADRDRLADRRQLPRHRAAAGQARLVHPRGAGLGRAGAGGRADRRGARAEARARSARWRSNCRCRPARCRRCGSRTSASSQSYLSAYPGYYQTADAGFIDEDGYIHVMTRTDDIINVAGHRLSTGGDRGGRWRRIPMSPNAR